MDSLVKFLLDYYVWILAVLGIIIVTIIGFLVDSKNKRKKQEKENAKGDSEIMTVEPLPDNNNENIPVVDAKTQPVPSVTEGVMVNENVSSIESNTLDNAVQFQNLENVNNNVSTVSDTLTLSEQKPHFEPKEVNIPNERLSGNIGNMGSVVTPQPVNVVPISNVVQPRVQSQDYTMINNMNPTMSQPQSVSQVYNSVNNNQQVQTRPVVQPQTSSVVQQQTVPIQNVMNSVQQPQAVSVAPSVATVPYNNTNVIQNQSAPAANQTVAASMPQQNTSTNPNVGINFVTGENQNNDMWKL